MAYVLDRENDRIVDTDTGEVVLELDGRDHTAILIDRLAKARLQEKLWKERGGYIQSVLLSLFRDDEKAMHSQENIATRIHRTDRRLDGSLLWERLTESGLLLRDDEKVILAELFAHVQSISTKELADELADLVEECRLPSRESEYIRVRPVPEVIDA